MSRVTDQLVDLKNEMEWQGSYDEAIETLNGLIESVSDVSVSSRYFVEMVATRHGFCDARSIDADFDAYLADVLINLNRAISEEKELDEDKSFARAY